MLEYAYDENGDFTYIENADSKLHTYKCPECNADLIVKNRVFEDRKKDPHFAHKDAEDCIGGSGESLEHRNTKILVYNLLKNSKQYIFTWGLKSKEEDEDFSDYAVYYDLLQGVDEIVMEKQTLGKFIPDISLKSNGKLLRAIEIVYTHKDEPAKTREYKLKHIDVFTVTTDKDIYKLVKNNEKQVEINPGKRNSERILLPELRLLHPNTESNAEEVIASIKALETNNFMNILDYAELKYIYEKLHIDIAVIENYVCTVRSLTKKNITKEETVYKTKKIQSMTKNLHGRLRFKNWGKSVKA